jgi:RNA polymerase sigma factor (sigma-70 family)
MSKQQLDIQKIIKDTVSEMLFELKKQGLMKDTKHTPFQKTEQLLYNYMNFKQVIIDKQKHIDFIKENGIQKKSKSIVSYSGNHQVDTRTDDEKANEQIEALENSILIIKRYIAVIDDALSKISNDKYYDLIRLRYFEGKTREEIAEYFDVDVATISRNKNRLINTLKIYLFSDEAIKEIFS